MQFFLGSGPCYPPNRSWLCYDVTHRLIVPATESYQQTGPSWDQVYNLWDSVQSENEGPIFLFNMIKNFRVVVVED